MSRHNAVAYFTVHKSTMMCDHIVALLLFQNPALFRVISSSSRHFIHSPVGELLQSHPQFSDFSGTDDMALIGLSAFQGSEKNPQLKSDLCVVACQGERGISRMFVRGFDMGFFSS